MLSTTGTSSQQVGGCLLDKIGAIINENGIVKFANDLKVDLSACCTKGTDAEQAKCVKELSPAYAAIIAKNKAKALKTIVKAASERLKGVTLKPMGLHSSRRRRVEGRRRKRLRSTMKRSKKRTGIRPV